MNAITDHILGESGGLFALGLIMGGIGGYGFATRTILSAATARITKLEAKVEDLQKQLMDEIRGS